MNIKYNADENTDYVIIFPIGSFDLDDSGFFESKVKEILKNTKRKKIVFNMKDLNYLNSTALNQFIGIYNGLLKTGHKIVFCNLTKPVEMLFNITSLKLLVPLLKSEWDAIKSLK
ncbi:MAG: STAS domain-containing protein [Candidatus Muiribacteriota bacterium]